MHLKASLSARRWLGIDHVFLTDNGSKEGDIMLEQLGSEFDKSFLTLRSELKERAQLPVYAWCAEEQRHRFNWIAYLDIDEFLVLRDSGCATSDNDISQLCCHWELVKVDLEQ